MSCLVSFSLLFDISWFLFCCFWFCCSSAGKVCVGGTARDLCLRGVTESLDGVYRTLYAAGLFLTAGEHTALRSHVDEFGRSYQRLRELSRRSGILAFGVTPKVHKFQHLPLVASSVNPRYCQCYAEEARYFLLAPLLSVCCSLFFLVCCPFALPFSFF